MADTNQQPTAVLRDEHQVILRVIEVLKQLRERSLNGGRFEVDSFKRCVEFFQLFADACHHAKEEDLLFPAIEACGIPREGGPIGVMLEEHQMARGFTKEMAAALEANDDGQPEAQSKFHDAAGKYIELLTNHIFKEDNILFNMTDQVLSGADQETLCSKFCEAGCRSFGGKKSEELRKMADELETASASLD